MRIAVVGLLMVLAPFAVVAQVPARPDTSRADSTRADSAVGDTAAMRALPREVVREVTDALNAPGALRVTGSLDIAAEREVTGDVAVLNGPVTVAGHITGRLVAVNADVRLEPGARIDGGLLAVGGIVDGLATATVGGEARTYPQVYFYREVGDRVVAEHTAEDEERWWRRWRRDRRRVWSNLILSSAHTYNRVEGLPLHIGPSLDRALGWGRVSVRAIGIIRTADRVHWDSDNLGHDLRAELRVGARRGIVLGARSYDVVDAVEDWQLTDPEVGLASFFLHRDYRDYFNRHGGRGFVSLVGRRDAELTLSYAAERWASRAQRDPFTLFRNEQPWRLNPAMDEGRFHLANATIRVDTRNDEADPWAGWYVVADVERGTGTVQPPPLNVPEAPPPPTQSADVKVQYTRGFLDLRRYNRLAPNAQLNLRAVVGGWLGGDPLPLERRLSVGGPGSLPGFDFRSAPDSPDVGYCTAGVAELHSGTPARCDRVALAQAEYRGDLHISLFGAEGTRTWYPRPWQTDAAWVLFADAGRGWLVGRRQGDLRYGRGQIPSLGTFRTDVGIGLDFDWVGVYVAKAVSVAKEPANFVVRVRRRF